MYAPSRDEARRFLVDAWGKYRASQPLTALEQIAVTIIARHPEYHALLEDSERHVERDFSPEEGTTNPFLHLALHLAVAEQLAIDQPPGIRAHFERLAAVHGDEHAALHAIADCLAETVWQAQRAGSAPDPDIYRDCLSRAR
jgi:Domain of unknown function (DUF1841)